MLQVSDEVVYKNKSIMPPLAERFHTFDKRVT